MCYDSDGIFTVEKWCKTSTETSQTDIFIPAKFVIIDLPVWDNNHKNAISDFQKQALMVLNQNILKFTML